ncbi:MAG TPA: UDP-N-acetylmuramoyl-L-alanine--D-glutamate ligase [archaeon]|nr:UDP-N-acetylmuramoyl-L-alanine--D-glutamate ligase [archaeon]
MKRFRLELGPGTGKPLWGPPAMVSVLGAGRSGLAAAELLAHQGYRVYLSDLRRNEALEESCRPLAGRGVEISLGKHDPGRLAKSDFIVISPGISEKIDLLTGAGIRDIPLFSEIELAYWLCPVPLVGITGTNGKSTTVTLLGEILNQAGIRTQTAGNIGKALCRAVSELTDERLLVAEISSFQLHTIRTFRPRLAIMLNLTPDHLERYSNVAEYYRAKQRIFENMGTRDLAILNADDPETASCAPGLRKNIRVAWFGFSESADHLTFVRAGVLFMRRRGEEEQRVIEIEKVRLPGSHNLENLLAAASAAAALGAGPDAVGKIAGSFAGLPHRLETVAEVDGVTYINDSKATTVSSVVKALQSLTGPVVLIMGGRHKGLPFKPLLAELRSRSVRKLIALGEASETISRELGTAGKVMQVPDLKQAVEEARKAALPGDVVLLSPGCSSFDQFTDFEERGNIFKEIVERMRANDA